MSEITLFCKLCWAPKYTERDYCCYCVGRELLKKEPFRVRMAYKLLTTQWKLFFVFHYGSEFIHPSLIPEHLRDAKWLTIDELNSPRKES